MVDRNTTMPSNSPKPLDLDDLGCFVVSVESGVSIYQEGVTGVEMHLIQEGRVEILRTCAGEPRVISELKPGDFFGEMSLLEGHTRGVSARASTDCRLLKIDHSAFGQMVREDPEIAVRMLRKLALRLRRLQEAALMGQPVASVMREGQGSAAGAEPGATDAHGGAVLVHRETGTEFPLAEDGETTVGRFDRVTGVSPDIDFTPIDTKKTLSRSHAKILREKGGFSIREDVATANGTFVNGHRLATGIPVNIKNGDKICFGRVEAEFKTL
jgi:CRP-like cAMP-binding protein